MKTCFITWGPFLEGPKKVSHRKAVAKSQTLYDYRAVLFILLMQSEVPFGRRRFRCVHLSAFKHRLKGLGHAILGNFSTDQMVIELTKM